MDIKNGVDIVYLPRFRETLSRGGADFMRRVYHSDELSDTRPERLAGMFAAKEAVIKALGLSLDAWHDVIISHEVNGAPAATIFNSKFQIQNSSLSISHDGEYVIAQFVALIEDA